MTDEQHDPAAIVAAAHGIVDAQDIAILRTAQTPEALGPAAARNGSHLANRQPAEAPSMYPTHWDTPAMRSARVERAKIQQAGVDAEEARRMAQRLALTSPGGSPTPQPDPRAYPASWGYTEQEHNR